MLRFDTSYLELLPVECKTAYENPDQSLRTAMRFESLKFEEFMTELKNREEWDKQIEEDENIEILVMNNELRKSVYEGADGNCTMTNESQNDFIACVTQYRTELYNAIIRTE